ncbi:hypothetical protein D6B98_30725 [Bradyrhizobium sp. LVM 105]|nr:hypothetical protein D6B98_30725 [Bradyrhizobium sp. LVM 105]
MREIRIIFVLFVRDPLPVKLFDGLGGLQATPRWIHRMDASMFNISVLACCCHGSARKVSVVGRNE